MMAIRISGTVRGRRRSARTLRSGSARATVVDMRTFMYEVRKHVKMNVSLSRKIHIIALPQGTGKACLSADQSATTPCRPVALRRTAVVVSASCCHRRVILRRQVDSSSPNSDQPDQQQVMPVHGAQLDARGARRSARPRGCDMPRQRSGPTPTGRPAGAGRAGRQHVEERIAGLLASVVAGRLQLLPRQPAGRAGTANANSAAREQPAAARARDRRVPQRRCASCMATLLRISIAVLTHRIGGSATGRQSRDAMPGAMAMPMRMKYAEMNSAKNEVTTARNTHSPMRAGGGPPHRRRAAVAAVGDALRFSHGLRRQPPDQQATRRRCRAAARRWRPRDSCGAALVPCAPPVGVEAVGRLVLRNEVLLGARHAVVVGPAIDHRQLRRPSCRASAACRASAIRAWSRARDCRRPACRCSSAPDHVEQEDQLHGGDEQRGQW